MDYIDKKLENIKTKGKGCIPDYYRLQGYCTAKGYEFISYCSCLNRPNRLTGVIIWNNDEKIASIKCEVDFLHPIKGGKQ